ncbi:MAG: UDP-glucose 4-epimerase GalE [Azospirillaceae bacterium]
MSAPATDRPPVLVTGGAGFIGSHTCKALHGLGYLPITVDNLSRGHRDAVKWGPLIKADLRDQTALRAAIAEYRPKAVIHLAAYAYVGESFDIPADYYGVNIGGTASLLKAMGAYDLRTLVFSSSCATYGVPESLPITETTQQDPINPYGRTKLVCEQMIRDCAGVQGLSYALLRYFNAAGADPDGELAERHDPETHIIPRAMLAALGDIDALDILGDDYPTPDGTCIRDYIHVTDLAEAHCLALEHLLSGEREITVNLGGGRGASIREVVDAIEVETGRRVPVRVSARRPGDPPALMADIAKAERLLGFRPRHSDLRTIIASAWPTFAAGREGTIPAVLTAAE